MEVGYCEKLDGLGEGRDVGNIDKDAEGDSESDVGDDDNADGLVLCH